MPATLVDSNVLLDILTDDPDWLDWSASALAQQADAGPLVVNPVIYAEVAARFERIEDLEEALPAEYYRRDPLPWEAAFLAGRCFVRYRRAGGQRRLQCARQAHVPEAGAAGIPNNPPRWPEATAIVKRILKASKENARDWERVGEWIERIGWPRFFELVELPFTKYHIDNWRGARKSLNSSSYVRF